MTRSTRLGCLLAIAIVVAFWIAVGLFVVSAIAAPRREAEFPARPSSGASHAPRLDSGNLIASEAAPLPSVASQAQPERTQDASSSGLKPMTGYTGNAGYAVPSLGASYLAVRLPRGTVVTVCGPGACWTTRTTDYGPSSRISPSRVADIAVGHWREVCGMAPSRGLCRVTIVPTPMAPATDVGGTP